MVYEVLSPWAEVDTVKPRGLRLRLDDLNGKTIGMYAHFKDGCIGVLQDVEAKLKPKYPEARFKYYQYPIDTAEVINDEKYKASFHEWLNGVDAVITSMGDAGSCTMYLAYNTANIENLGKPAVMLLYDVFMNQFRRGSSSRGVPGLRNVPVKEKFNAMGGGATVSPEIIDGIVKGLTTPLTGEEKNPKYEARETRRIVFKGDIQEVNDFFYMSGWTNGTPIIPPTEEAVKRMLEGTDLSPDYLVAKIPPMGGKATVEKIAINAVMAGCLPIYMPVLIAAVKGMVDPKIHLEGWTCSAGSWAPLIIISGKLAGQLKFNTGQNFMSPYLKPSSTIAHAFALMIMNIGGTRSGLEDTSFAGHENRFGICIAEDHANPWGPLHTDYGIDKDDSAVTLLWSAEHQSSWSLDPKDPFATAADVGSILSRMLNVTRVGFFHGAAYIADVNTAQTLLDAGFTRKDVINYIVEYCRRPASEAPLSWMKSNHHYPTIIKEGELKLPEASGHSTRVFFDNEHLLIAVTGGGNAGVFAGGGDHGGPCCTKIDLPEKWKELLKEYEKIEPTYVRY